MKLGIKAALGAEQVEDLDCSEEAIAIAQLEAIEAAITLSDATDQLDSFIEATSNLQDVVTTVEAHGIDDALVSLIGEDISEASASFAAKDAEASVEEINVAVEGLKEKTLEIINKIWESIKSFMDKIVRFFYKVEDSVKKKIEKLDKMSSIKWKKDSFEWTAESKDASKDLAKFIAVYDKSFGACIDQMAEFKSGKFTGNVKGLKDLVAWKDSASAVAKKELSVTRVASKEKVKTVFAEYKEIAKDVGAQIKATQKLQKEISGVKIKKLDDTAKGDIKANKALSACSKFLSVTNGAYLKHISVANKVLGNMVEAKA
jgi:hypothetical protein